VLVLTARDSLTERVNTLNQGADGFLAQTLRPRRQARSPTDRLGAPRPRQRAPRFAAGPSQLRDRSPANSPLHGAHAALSRARARAAQGAHHAQRRTAAHGGSKLWIGSLATNPTSKPSAIDMLLHRLRKRLEHSGVHIHTYRDLGYVLNCRRRASQVRRSCPVAGDGMVMAGSLAG